MGAGQGQSLLSHAAVTALAGKHGKTPAQILLRWAIERGTSIIPKSKSKERLKENISVFDFFLTPEDMATLAALDTHTRQNDPGHFTTSMNSFVPIYD